MSTRNLFNNDHSSPGKGDAPRSKFDKNWSKKFSAIKWPVGHDAGFMRKGNRLVKLYTRVLTTDTQ